MYLIYKLYDPRDQEKTPRYIGITATSIKLRLQRHIEQAKSKKKINWHRFTWIRKLLNENIIPIIEVIDFANSQEEVFDKEKYWISYFKNQGIGLTNMTLGGEGNPLRKVKQFLPNGTFIKTWDTISQVEKDLGISNSHITSCCKGIRGRKIVKGYVWRYEEDSFNKYPLRSWKVYKKTILQINPKTLEVIKEWEKSQDIEDVLGFRRSNISYACRNQYLKNGFLRKCHGYYWLFKTDEDIVRSLRKLRKAEEVDISINTAEI